MIAINDQHQTVMSEAELRAGAYTLLAKLLAAPPDAETLARLRDIQGSPGTQDLMATAWLALKQAAEETQTEALDDEYHALFIGVGRGELVPYGSWYKSGFLMEKPLGELRRDLASLGYTRDGQVHEPEDHGAALCEVMALLIQDPSISLEQQKAFFETHVGCWMETFFADLEAAQQAAFYRAVGALGRAFMGLERTYLTMLS